MGKRVAIMISVITVVKDDASGLASTYKSLQGQSLSEWEMILVVSPSNDNTLEVAESLFTNDQRVSFNFQEAKGIYEAMNLGLTKVNGSHIWFMNAGDTFASNNVLEHALMTTRTTGTSLVIGGYRLGNKSGDPEFRYRSKRISRLRFAFNLRMSHQSMIFDADAYKEIGNFNLNYRLASDFDFILKYMKSNSARTTDMIYAVFRPGGAADQNIEQVHYEKHLSRKANFPNWLIIPASTMWTTSARLKIFLRKTLN